VAIEDDEADQMPPDTEEDNVVAAPTQSDDAPLSVPADGALLTVMLAVANETPQPALTE
jgi:hypothetical protein